MTRATGTNWPDILDLVDQGERGRAAGYSAIEPTRCVRRGCRAQCVGGSGFCGPCLAWVSGDTEEDTIGEKLDVPSPQPWFTNYPPEGDDEWHNYLKRPR